MTSPYNLEVFYNCLECTARPERIFCNMQMETVEALEAIKFTTVYPRGSILFAEGEAPRGVFILCSGRVKLTASSTEGRTLILKIAEPGEVLGLSAAILGKSYQMSAETLEPSQVNFVKRNDFLSLLQNHAEASLHTAEQLSKKYHAAQREIRSLGLSKSTAEKLAALLLDWCESNGQPTPEGVRLKVLLTHEEIAQMVSTTRETVTRLLSDFKKKGVIDVRGSTFIVLKRNSLEKMLTI